MTILRCVTQRIPATTTVLDETSLPFSFVLSPFGPRPDLEYELDYELDGVEKSKKQAPPLKASLVAKCTNCGAPLNLCSPVLSSSHSDSRVLCSLCGKVYALSYDAQHAARGGPRNTKAEEEQYKRRYHRQKQKLDECHKSATEYTLPLFPNVYAQRVASCPPLLAVLVDGTFNNKTFLDAVVQSVHKIVDAAPSHAFFGLFLVSVCQEQQQTMNLFDLTSSIPHVRSGRSFTSNSESHCISVPLSQMVHDITQVFVSLSPSHKQNVKNAVRTMGDTLVQKPSWHDDGKNEENTARSVYLGSAVEAILDLMEDFGACHPGTSDLNPSLDTVDDESSFRYAGGKIMCFLSGPPAEIGRYTTSEGTIGTGGFGGTCAEIGRRNEKRMFQEPLSPGYAAYYGQNSVAARQSFEEKSYDLDPETGDYGTVTASMGDEPSNKADSTNHEQVLPRTAIKDVDDYFQDLGIRCAKAAFGVEIFALLDTEGVYVGLPHLRILTDRSGGCGPLLIRLPDEDTETVDGSDWCLVMLMKEVVARTPWNRPTAFGGMLRIRLSPSLRIERSPHDTIPNNSPGKYYKSHGISGPVAPSPDDDDLVIVGTCDDCATLSFDVEIDSSSGIVNDTSYVEGRGDVDLSPCVQTCFAYTAIVEHGDGELVTVRRLRVLTTKLQLARDTESLFSSVDGEALALALFHKLYRASLQYGLLEAHTVAQEWLLSVLLCTYRSAQRCHSRMRLRSSRGYTKDEGFFASARLLHHRALSDRNILLAQGHDRLQALPLLVFSLLNCDALRPWDGSFRPSSDARCAAAANLGIMPPSSIARCVAPRLELWSSNSKEAVCESIGMSMDAFRQAIAEQRAGNDGWNLNDDNLDSDNVPLLLLDSPRQIMVCNCNQIDDNDDVAVSNLLLSVSVPVALTKAVQDAVQSYRVAPPVQVSTENEICFASQGSGMMAHLQDALVEDILAFQKKQNFFDWCTDIAELAHGAIIVARSDDDDDDE